MDFTVSALSFVGPKMKWMAQLPKDMGIEIFWEYGSEDYWKQMLPVLLSERSGAFSIHGPSVCEDISQAGNTEAIMKRLCRPFDVYHQFHSRFYVLHTNGKMPPNLTPEESAQRRAIALERIAAFQERCTASDVTLVVENVNGAPGIPPLFSQTDFLDTFKQLPDLLCLLDTGHALMSQMDISAIQKTLGSRIFAYHVHDNDGTADQHKRIGQGVCDWTEWAAHYRQYTPSAEIVFEYDGLPQVSVYQEDQLYLEKIITHRT